MGLSRTVTFSTDSRPTWESVRLAAATLGETPVVGMIDNLPAFPDEIPDPYWTDLRLALSSGMVTIRSTPSGWIVSIWGNADEALRRCWNIVLWAIASAGQGSLILDDGRAVLAEEFRHLVLR